MLITFHPIVLGIDVSKAKLDAVLLINSSSHHGVFKNTKTGLARLVAWLRKFSKEPFPAVMEATGSYGELAATTLHEAGFLVSVVNGRRIKHYAMSIGRRNKTDKADAQIIASYGRANKLDQWLPPAPHIAQLRDLTRRLATLEGMLRAESCRDQLLVTGALKDSLSRLTTALAQEIKAVKKEIKTHIAKNPCLLADCARLMAIEGIGQKSAQVIIAELPRHLSNARAAAAWASVCPRKRQSGSSLNSTDPSGNYGNRHIRHSLYMCAVVARNKNPRLKLFADRLAANGKAKMAVIIAVLHKLIRITFSLLKHQSSYQPNHSPSFIHSSP